jgi:hypothetical protein
MVLNLVGAGTWFFAVSNLFTVYQIQVFHGIFKGIFVLGSLQLPIRDLELDLKKQV